MLQSFVVTKVSINIYIKFKLRIYTPLTNDPWIPRLNNADPFNTKMHAKITAHPFPITNPPAPPAQASSSRRHQEKDPHTRTRTSPPTSTSQSQTSISAPLMQPTTALA